MVLSGKMVHSRFVVLSNIVVHLSSLVLSWHSGSLLASEAFVYEWFTPELWYSWFSWFIQSVWYFLVPRFTLPGMVLSAE